MPSQAGLWVAYSQPLESVESPWQRLEQAFAEQCLRSSKRGAIAGNWELIPSEVLQRWRGRGFELRPLSGEQPDPFAGAGWPVLVLPAEPRLLLQVLEDRRVSAVIYIPRNAAELRHFTTAYPDTVAV